MNSAVIKHKELTLGRIESFLSSKFYTRVNLRGRLYPDSKPLSIQHYAAPGRVPFEQVVNQTFQDVTLPANYGPTWSTHWFRIDVAVPQEWKDEDVRLIWDANCEAMLWEDGTPKQGLSGFPVYQIQRDYKISQDDTGFKKTLYIEMACNGNLGQGQCGDLISAPDLEATFTVRKAELSTVNKKAYELFMDIEVLYMMAKDLPEDSHRRHQALLTANEVINTVSIDQPETYDRARGIAQKFLREANGDSQMVVYAMGHCHIDCAWLWSYAETIRKCGRSWSSTVRLMQRYPDMTFACSQAQQFLWVKEAYPRLYEDIRELVREGRFVPVGGTWVEMDGNLPSGESFVRQVLYGQRFFMQEFGLKCKEFWLPDTFGYSGQLPQIVLSGGMTRFLTQKISWGVNKFPHHTFEWEGLDGSIVLTHFPPGNSYHMNGTVKELLLTKDNCEDKGRVRSACYLYGYGDGGGGPTETMLERLERLKDVDGVPRVIHATPSEFFDNVEKEEAGNLCRWSGELYLEFHQGTYTSQAQTKRYNRRLEFLMHDVELLWSLPELAVDYPVSTLEELWRKLLLNQFHDVLPGSSIQDVYVDAMEIYTDVEKQGLELLDKASTQLFKPEQGSTDGWFCFNTLSWSRDVIIEMPEGAECDGGDVQKTVDGRTLGLAKVPSMGYVCENHGISGASVTIAEQEGEWVLQSPTLTVKVDNMGRLTSVIVKGREVLPPGGHHGNQFVLFEDTPAYWDAWDLNHYHLETRREVTGVTMATHAVDTGPLEVSLKFEMTVGQRSKLSQTIRLNAVDPYVRFETQVDWHEDHKFLKVEFPINVRTTEATYETQFGYVRRPNHRNTSHDWMKFEVGGHKWADLSEHGFGAAVLNDCKYGYSCYGNILSLSLLKAPKAPDEMADMGQHSFTYAFMPHHGSFQEAGVIQRAYELNSPVICRPTSCSPAATTRSYFSVSEPAVILDTVKRSEDDCAVLVLRLFEAYGGSATANVTVPGNIKSAKLCNVLEEPLSDAAFDGNVLILEFTPFKLVSVLLELE